MKTKSTLVYLALALGLFHSMQAEARIYTVTTVRECENQVENTVGGVVGGGIVGGVLAGTVDMLATGGRNLGSSVAIGVGSGAVIGGIMGSELSCRERVVHHRNIDTYLSRPDWDGYRNDNMRVVLLGYGLDYRGNQCRTYHLEYRTRSGWAATQETACWDGYMWRHGYESSVIIGRPIYNRHAVIFFAADHRIRARQSWHWENRHGFRLAVTSNHHHHPHYYSRRYDRHDRHHDRRDHRPHRANH